MKKTMKVFSIIVMMLLVFSFCMPAVSAITPSDLDEHIKVDSTGQTKLQDFGKGIVAVIQTVGVVIAVVILLVLGVKYMMGSAEEKAEYKKTMIPYLVGAVVIFASTTIVNIIYNLAQGLNAK